MRTNRLAQLLRGRMNRSGVRVDEPTTKFDRDYNLLTIYGGSYNVAYEKRIPATQVNVLRKEFPKIFN